MGAVGDVEAFLARMEEVLASAEAEMDVVLGGLRQSTTARVWQGQVLVEWERDDEAGGCLLRPMLVRRLLALNARAAVSARQVTVEASPRIVAALSPRHARLEAGLGGAPTLRLTLRFDGPDQAYRGGEEVYSVRQRGRPNDLLRVTARVRPRAAPPPPASART